MASICAECKNPKRQPLNLFRGKWYCMNCIMPKIRDRDEQYYRNLLIVEKKDVIKEILGAWEDTKEHFGIEGDLEIKIKKVKK